MGLASGFSSHFKNGLARHCVVSLITAWCIVAFINMVRLSTDTFNPVESLATNRYTSLPVYLGCMLGLTVVLTAAAVWLDKRIVTDGFMFVCAFVCGIEIVLLRQEVYTCLAVTGLVLLAFSYFASNVKITDIVISTRTMIIIIAAAAVLLAGFIGVTAVYRYLTYNVPNYDGGLFFQMFYYMKNHLTMQTTLERDTLMSHMNVHVSPVFWLLFPIYYVFPYNQTVQICQGIVLASAVIPLSMICIRRNISKFKTALLCVIYCFMPYVAGGCGYDIHENIFLPVAIFCMLYAFESSSWRWTILSLVFLLSVKEDAGIYAAFIGIYMLAERGVKDKTHLKALTVIAVSVVYFAAAVAYIQSAGVNSATDRFNNMIFGADGNILGIIPTIIMNPAYTLKEILNADNISYIVQVLAPMLFLPLFCRNYRLYILLCPFLLFNLMPSYEYMHDIGFQYTFGSATMLFYMLVCVTDKGLKCDSLKVLCMCAVAAVLFFVSGLSGRLDYIAKYNDERYQQIYNAIDDALSYIPDDAEVTASTFLCGRLACRDVIYEDFYTDNETEYLALDLRGTDYDYDIGEFYESKGYTMLAYTDGLIAVFRKN